MSYGLEVLKELKCSGGSELKTKRRQMKMLERVVRGPCNSIGLFFFLTTWGYLYLEGARAWESCLAPKPAAGDRELMVFMSNWGETTED